MANSVDPLGAVWSGSILFAICYFVRNWCKIFTVHFIVISEAHVTLFLIAGQSDCSLDQRLYRGTPETFTSQPAKNGHIND